MKVALNHRVHDGPWGGGNRFAAALVGALRARGDVVVDSLADPDVDLIVIVDPRSRNPALAFGPGAVLRYLAWRNPRCLVVHRINECDERKGTRTMNRRLRLANYAADHTVFIASWLRELDLWRREDPGKVILNGADPAVFHARGQVPWDGRGPLRLVTHHWGAHRNKGFDVYQEVDRLLGEPAWAERIAFTYVGNLPAGTGFRHVRHVAPLDGAALAAELRGHHAYITASINEPAGMHHIEGALGGLPLLYRDSGGLPEYCAGYGEAFDGPAGLAPAIERMLENYPRHKAALAAYPHTAERMCGDYLALFDRLMADREAIVGRRRLWRDPMAFLLNQIPW